MIQRKGTSEEGELADWVTEEDVVLKVVSVHNVLEDKLEI